MERVIENLSNFNSEKKINISLVKLQEAIEQDLGLPAIPLEIDNSLVSRLNSRDVPSYGTYHCKMFQSLTKGDVIIVDLIRLNVAAHPSIELLITTILHEYRHAYQAHNWKWKYCRLSNASMNGGWWNYLWSRTERDARKWARKNYWRFKSYVEVDGKPFV